MNATPESKPKRTLSKDGSVHVTDEVYNTLISATGAVLSLIGIGYLLFESWSARKMGHFWGFALYGLGVLGLFTASTLHHGINGSEKTEYRLRQIDYFVIFIMIATAVTPFATILLKNLFGWWLVVIAWCVASLGITIKAVYPDVSKKITTALYLGMGWLGVLVVWPIYQKLGLKCLGLFVLGGIFYNIGAFIYLLEKPNPFPGKFGFHEIWHLCFLGGTASHYFMMAFYLLPY